MTHREKMLTGAVAAAGVLWFGTQGLTRYRDALDRNEALRAQAEQALTDAQTAEYRGQKARKQLNQWISQSLPSNRDVAESLYQDWLRSQATEAGLQVTQLANKTGNARNPQFDEVSFELRATGTMEQLADFLYRFYSAPHLHRIASATLLAEDGGKKLNITATASALILPDVKRTNRLADGDAQQLAKSKEAFRKSLADRNLFVAYTPKAGDGDGQKDDVAAKTKFVWTDYGAYGWRMGVQKDGDSELTYYQQGDEIEVGELKGKVVQLDAHRAVIETSDGRVEVRFGQNFGEAAPLPAPA
ncbi:MAG TPA: hypothetical protein VF175_01170, partial [Lacipirellula sp.]